MERLFFLALFMSVVNSKVFNDKTCVTLESPSFVAYEMKCVFEGSDVYIYDGPPSVHTLNIDRLTVHSRLFIPPITTLDKVIIGNGDITCDSINAPEHVAVFIEKLLCVSIDAILQIFIVSYRLVVQGWTQESAHTNIS